MRRLVTAFAFLALVAGPATAQVITFDDLATKSSFWDLGIAGSYEGFAWGTTLFGTQATPVGWASATATSPAFNPGPTPLSGSSYAWNGSGAQSLFIDFHAPLSFAGGYFATYSTLAGWWNASTVQLFGYDGAGQLVASSTVLGLTAQWQWLEAGFSNVRGLEIRGNAPYKGFAVDDLTLADPQTLALEDEDYLEGFGGQTVVTPEPGTMVLLATGLAALSLAGLRRRRSG